MLHTLSCQHAYFPLDVKALVNLSSHCFSSLMKMCFSFFKNAIFTQKMLRGGGSEVVSQFHSKFLFSICISTYWHFLPVHRDHWFTIQFSVLNQYLNKCSPPPPPSPQYSSVFDFFCISPARGYSWPNLCLIQKNPFHQFGVFFLAFSTSKSSSSVLSSKASYVGSGPSSLFSAPCLCLHPPPKHKLTCNPLLYLLKLMSSHHIELNGFLTTPLFLSHQ